MTSIDSSSNDQTTAINDENAAASSNSSTSNNLSSSLGGAMKVFGNLVANAVDSSITSVSKSPGLNRYKQKLAPPPELRASNCNDHRPMKGRRIWFANTSDNTNNDNTNDDVPKKENNDHDEQIDFFKPATTRNVDHASSATTEQNNNQTDENSPKLDAVSEFENESTNQKIMLTDQSSSNMGTDSAMPFASPKRKRSEDQVFTIDGKQAKERSTTPFDNNDDKFDKMQAAVESVNESLRGVRRAKDNVMKQKAEDTRKLKEKRLAERREIESFNEEAEKQRRELLQLKNQRLREYQQTKVNRQYQAQKHKLQLIDEETNFKSEVYRDHKRSLKDDEDRRRRESTDARAKVRIDQRKGKEKIRMRQIEEESTLLEERREGSIAKRTYETSNSDQRRQSLAFRNGDARRIRELYAQMQSEENQAQHEGYELKWAGEKDAEEYKRQCEEDRRKSLAFRNQEGYRIRKEMEDQRVNEVFERQQSNELKWAGEKDAEDYKRQCDEQRRQSLAFRNQEGHRIRREAESERLNEIRDRQKSNELKWEGEKDAEEYKRQCEEDRRKSLAFRNQEGYRIRKEMEDQRVNEVNERHQSNELKWAGEKDAEEYKRQREEDRRKSLAFRNQEGRRVRDVEASMKAEEAQATHESYELKWDGERDAKAYERKCDEERRASLAFRNQEGVRHRAVMEELLSITRQQEHESMVLKWAGEDDVKAYLKDVESERRASLQLRNQEGRRIRQLEQEIHDEDINKQAEDEKLKADCQRDVENYKKECATRDRKSLEYRGQESRLRRLVEEDDRIKKSEQESASIELEAEARRDVHEYVKKCNKRRRMSLAQRAKEQRRYAEWKKEEHVKQIESTREEVNNRLIDRRFAQLALEREKAQRAIDAITCAGKALSNNPFKSFL